MQLLRTYLNASSDGADTIDKSKLLQDICIIIVIVEGKKECM